MATNGSKEFCVKEELVVFVAIDSLTFATNTCAGLLLEEGLSVYGNLLLYVPKLVNSRKIVEACTYVGDECWL